MVLLSDVSLQLCCGLKKKLLKKKKNVDEVTVSISALFWPPSQGYRWVTQAKT